MSVTHPDHRRTGLIVAGVMTAVSAGLLSLRAPELPLQSSLWGLAIFWIGLVPTAWHVLQPKLSGSPIFPVAGAFYSITFGLPVFMTKAIWPKGSQALYSEKITGRYYYDSIYYPDLTSFFEPQAMALACAGVTLFAIAFMVSRRFVTPTLPTLRLADDTRQEVSQGRLVFLLWVLLIGALAYEWLPPLRRIASLGQFFVPAGYVAFGMFLVLWVRRDLELIQGLAVFAIALPLVLFKKITGGFLTPIILYGLFFSFLLFSINRRLMIGMTMAMIVLLAAVYPAIHKYRAHAWAGPWIEANAMDRPKPTLSDKAQWFGAILLSYWRGDVTITVNGITTAHTPTPSYTPIAKRLALVPVFSHVYLSTPGKVPYWRGETYKTLFTNFIPRVFWRDKPKEIFGTEFGMRYGLITDRNTSINIPWLVELLMNFGAAGVIVGMALIGGALALLDRLFNSANMGRLESVVGLAIIFPLVYAESNLSLMVGSILPLTLCLYIFFRVGFAVRFGGRHLD